MADAGTTMGEGVLASFSQVTDAGAIRVRRVAGFS
jgi:hypothetical protein